MPDRESASRHLTSSIRRVFLGWDQPILDLVVAKLWSQADLGEDFRVVDLSGLLLVLPTRDAGRHVKSALADRAAEHKRIVFPPVILTPGRLLQTDPVTVSSDAAGQRPRAAAAMVRAGWMEALQNCPAEDRERVFPFAEPTNFRWLLATATELDQLAEDLAAAGVSLKAAADSHLLAEDDRWRTLARLERSMEDFLARHGLDSPLAAKERAAWEIRLPEGTDRWIVACAPDLPQLSQVAISQLTNRAPGEIWIHAPESMAETFSAHGIPLPVYWNPTAQTIPWAEERLRKVADLPTAVHETLGIWADECVRRGEPPVICPVDPEIIPELTRAAAEQGARFHNAEGTPLGRLEFCETVRAWLRWLESESWEDAHRFWALPAASSAARRTAAPSIGWLDLLLDSDKVQERVLPSRLSDAAPALESTPEEKGQISDGFRSVLQWMIEWRARWETEPLETVCEGFLQELFGSRESSAGDHGGAALQKAWEAWNGILADIQPLLADAADPVMKNAGDAAGFVLSLIEHEPYDPGSADALVNMPGWLELAWTPGSQVILTGLHDGALPDGVKPSPWLKESSREGLGLSCDKTRVARDLFLLRAAHECRSGGIVPVLWATTHTGEPTRPSRFLFACPDAELPQRVKLLYNKEKPPRSLPQAPSSRGWKLMPVIPYAPFIPARLNAHHIQDYLVCPFRFFLKHIKRAKVFEPFPLEMNAMDFGNLIHDAVNPWAATELGRELRSASDLRDLAIDTLEQSYSRKFGSRSEFILHMQRHYMTQRLERAAELEAISRAEGWIPVAAELDLTSELHKPHGIPLGGKLDRWDRKISDESVARVVDYKTGKVKGASAMLTRTGDAVEHQPWRTAPITGKGDKVYLWTNVQLPIYAALLEEHTSIENVQAEWFAVPETKTDSKLVSAELTAELVNSALACASGVAECIRQGIFWPPAEDLRHDDLGQWLPDPLAIQTEGADFDREIRALYASAPPSASPNAF